jgi:hypothetical protein
MITYEQFQWIIALLLGNIVTVLVTGYKLSRYFIKIEVEHNMMWTDYEKRHDLSV